MSTPRSRRRRGSISAMTVAALTPAGVAVASPDAFTVIGLPDTQNYSESYPEIFLAQTQWISSQLASLDIRFVSHYGDVVQHGDDLEEWDNAEAALSVLDATGVPWGVVPGNHDVTPAGISGSPYIPQFFRDRFGPQRWAGRPWYLGSSPSGMSSATAFHAAGRAWLWLHVECDLPVREMEWAQSVLDAHRGMPAVLTTHRWLQDAEDYTGGVPLVPSGRYPGIWYQVEGVYADGGVQVEDAWRWFVRRNPSIFLVNCGHFHEEFRQTSVNVAGLPVHEVLADYQDDPNGGDGWLRIMRFDVAEGRIDFESFSPTLQATRTADESLFSLPVAFDAHGLPSTEAFSAFQEGIGGYVGTQDTWVDQSNPDASYGDDAIRISDDDVQNALFSDARGQVLIRWDGIVGPTGAAAAIPAGATVLEAFVTIEVAEDIDSPFFDPDFAVYEVIRPWDESSTWNSLDGGLVPGEDLGELVGTFTGDNDPDADGMRRIDVTGLVQRWVDGQPNQGIAIMPEIIPGNDDGIGLWTSESANALLRPRLEVRWLRPAPPCSMDVDGDGSVGFTDLLAVLDAWGPCAFCAADLNRDGTIDFDDVLLVIGGWGACR